MNNPNLSIIYESIPLYIIKENSEKIFIPRYQREQMAKEIFQKVNSLFPSSKKPTKSKKKISKKRNYKK
ncbi:MAG: hypothetical protein KDK36_03030 [Leptospiraceae bacterium]|nr:hypothetical protein [Leptospiraceae bacterium]